MAYTEKYKGRAKYCGPGGKLVRPVKYAGQQIFKAGEGGWGSNIYFMKDLKFHVAGHNSPRPRPGDWLVSKMESGKTGIFIFWEVEYCSDPPDMFFGKMSWNGYDVDGKATQVSVKKRPKSMMEKVRKIMGPENIVHAGDI